jgi:hypothetical protein
MANYSRTHPHDKFYAYLWLRENGTPWYAGKGQGNRAYIHPERGIKPPSDRSRIVIMNSGNEAEALETEKELIHNWGRKDNGTGILHNLTDGGENPPNFRGRKRSDKWVASMFGNKRSLGWPKGKLRGPQTEEHRRKMSAAVREAKRG